MNTPSNTLTPEHSPLRSPDAVRHEIETRRREDNQFALKLLTEAAHFVARCREKFRRVWADLQELLNAHPDFVHTGHGRAFTYTVIGLFVLAVVLFLDFLLMSPAAEFLASLGLRKGTARLVAQILVPLSVIGLEIYLSEQMHIARQEVLKLGRSGRSSDWTEYRIWKVVGLFMSLVIPLLAVATFIQRAHVSGTSIWDLDLPMLLLLVGLLLLSIVCHVAILFGGSQAHWARGYWGFRFRRRRLDGRAEKAGIRYEKARTNLAHAFADYRQQLDLFNWDYPEHPLRPGPFDQVTRMEVNDCLGTVITGTYTLRDEDDETPATAGDEHPETTPGSGGDDAAVSPELPADAATTEAEATASAPATNTAAAA